MSRKPSGWGDARGRAGVQAIMRSPDRRAGCWKPGRTRTRAGDDLRQRAPLSRIGSAARSRAPRRSLLLAGTFLSGLGFAGHAAAQDATWVGNGTPTASWNTAANWNPANVPLDIATFNASPSTTVTFSAASTIDTMVFNPGASSYTFNLSGQSLEVTAAAFGAGIVNNSGVAQTVNAVGLLQFSNQATAGNLIINNTPGATTFTGQSNAGTSTITNSGGGITTFTDISSAGSATITTNAASLTQFLSFSDGGNARFITNAGGTVDFSGTSGVAAINQVSAGSIEGAGTYNLGANALTVGGNNLSTVVSGTINDGGSSGGTGASLIKEGTGTLTLSGVNTYTGATIINAGTVLMAGAGTLGASTAQLSVGVATLDLGGTTQTTGAMNLSGGSIINGTLNSTSYLLQGGLVSALLTGGALTKDGAGTVTLTNANTYSGGTTINDGVLSINNGNALSTGAIVMNGGTLNASQTFSLANSITFFDNSTASVTASAGRILTLAGGLSFNAGSITTFGSPTDTGTVLFNPSATSADSTASVVVGGGTLSAASNELGNVLSVAQLTMVNAGATLAFNDFFASIRNLNGAGSVNIGVLATSTLFLTVDPATTQEFSGVISGPGKMSLSGAGIQILSGDNTYGGGTTVASGSTLQLGNGGNTGSVLGNIVNDGMLSFNRANTYNFTGVVSGAGDLSQDGPGTTVLTNVNTYMGATTVNAGTLQVDGSIVTSSGVTVNGGTLAGVGIVPNVTVNGGGAFAPGAAPGTAMTISGSLAFMSGALYLVQINGAGQTTKANVSGSAALAGATASVNALPGGYTPGTSYTILTANGGLGGTQFAGLNVSGPVTGHLAYDANNVFFIVDGFMQTALTLPPGLSQNQQNVGNAINNFINNGGALPPRFQTLLGLSDAQLASALTQLSGESATGAQQGAFQLMNQFLGLMLDPFAGSSAGFGAPGGGATGFAPERALFPDDLALAYAKVTKAPVTKAQPSFEQRWTVWGAAYGGYNRTSGDPTGIGSHDLSTRAGGFAVGMDYRLNRDSVVGFALAGAGTGWGLAQGLGSGRSDAAQAGVYGATRSGPIYFAASAAFTNYWMSTDRVAFGDRLTADFNAQSYGVRGEIGVRVATPVGAFTPYAAVQTQNFRTPNYRELDLVNGGFGLAFNARNATDTRTELGARFDSKVLLERGALLVLRGKLAWAHDSVSDPSVAAVFQALPGAGFTVNGAAVPADTALVSAGAEYRMTNGVAFIGKFDGEFANRYATYAGTGTLRVSW